jgi:hypothetical protein
MLDLLTMSSSDDLLLMIAYEVRHDNSQSAAQSQTDLLNLSLTCRRLRAVGCEVLYQSPVIPQPQVENGTFGGSYFARTLLERPSLAKRVRTLVVSIAGTSRRVGHRASCPYDLKKYCQCDWYNVYDLFESHIMAIYRNNGSALYIPKWLKNIRCGKERAVFGMLLACTPNLQGLSIQKRGDYQLIHGVNRFDSGQLCLWKMFCMSEDDEEPDYTKIPGFRNL